tara:strand:- start:235 stop:1953 length:1719 start_codon:yes stop_codon:yes gene_type:complete
MITNPIHKNMLSRFTASHIFVFSCIGIILPPSIYFYFVYSYSLNLPFADDFTNLDQVMRIFQASNLNDSFSIFFTMENGHRVAFTRFVYTFLYAIFGEINFKILILVGNFSLVILLYLFFRILEVPRKNLIYFIPISILLFQLQFWKNMTWAASSIQHNWILLFTGLTFYFCSKKSNLFFYSALCLAIASIFTHAGGWVTMLLGLIILLTERRYRESIIWAIVTFFLGFFYFKGFHSSANITSGIQSFDGFKNFLIFYSAFLGSALSPNKVFIAASFGVILNLYLVYLIIDKYFSRNITVFMFMAYIFFNAVLVAMSRSDLGVENVFAPRYKIVSVILIILVYMSLAEKLSSSLNQFRGFVFIGILFALTSYSLTFKSGKYNLETKNLSLKWLANQWVNTNHGFFYTSGNPGVNDKIPNSILLRALENKFYKLPYQLLYIPDQGYSPFISLPITCVSGKNNTFSSKFSVISMGPEANPYLVRLEGMIHSSIADKKENKSNIYLILKSRKSNYIFKTHPHQFLIGSAFFDENLINAGFIALVPFEKIEVGLYQIGFCYKGSINFGDRFLSKKR